MTQRKSPQGASIFSIALAALLLFPAGARTARAALVTSNVSTQDFLQDPQDGQDKEQERRDREQEARDREQEKRDREQEKRDREQERTDRFQERYDQAREALDEDHYEKAAQKFAELAQMNGPQTDAALYWKAYAENKLGRKAAALADIAEIKSKYAQSKWKKDAEALELELRQSAGVKPNPDAEPDKDLKALALRALWQSDPERALPITEKILNGSDSPKYKSNVLFVAAQSGSSQGMELLTKIARGQSNPELQRKAVEYLAMFGGRKTHETLKALYD